MSYSFRIERAAADTIRSEVDAKTEALPEGPGKDEARQTLDLAVDGLSTLAALLPFDEFAASVSGHASLEDGKPVSVSLNLNVYRPVQPMGEAVTATD